MDRNDKILAQIAADARVLEFGPSFAPVLPKATRANVFSLDHADQQGLREKYRPMGVDVDAIEPVDFVWTGGAVHDAVPAELHGTFDAIIASHVLEHVPDPVRFFQSAARLLKPGGALSLVNPDKRYCFDLLKPASTTADMLEAYEQARDRHTRKSLYYLYNAGVTNSGATVWGAGTPIGALSWIHRDLIYSPPQPGEDDTYVDCHAWFYTPASFELIVLELAALDLIPFRKSVAFEPWGCEFYITLVKGDKPDPASLADERMRLTWRMLKEMQDQIGTWSADAVPGLMPGPLSSAAA